MHLDWPAFTPWPALIGGALIGLASALFVLGSGRIAGIAGLIASPLRALWTRGPMAPERTRLVFIGGLLAAPWLWQMVAPLPAVRLDVGLLAVLAAGVLVGVGVRMGDGCTSGHGVCGLSRLSLRSAVNVLAFMGAGVLTVTALRHVL